MGLYHIGVCKVLWHHKLLPKVISGSSAGSMVAALLAVTTDENVKSSLFNAETYHRALLEDLDSTGAISRRVGRLFKTGVRVTCGEW